MNLKEAFERANDGDTLVDNHSTATFLKGDYKNIMVSLVASFSIGWEVIPAEPKVLSEDEAFERDEVQDMIGGNEKWNHGCEVGYRTGFQDGDKNGQLKEWLNHKELREAVSALINSIVYASWANMDFLDYREYVKMIKKAHENLKPLNVE